MRHDFLQQRTRSVVERRQHAAHRNVGRKSGWSVADISHGEVCLDLAYACANRQSFFSSGIPSQKKATDSEILKHVLDLIERHSPLVIQEQPEKPLLKVSFEVEELFKNLLKAIPTNWEVKFFF